MPVRTNVNARTTDDGRVANVAAGTANDARVANVPALETAAMEAAALTTTEDLGVGGYGGQHRNAEGQSPGKRKKRGLREHVNSPQGLACLLPSIGRRRHEKGSRRILRVAARVGQGQGGRILDQQPRLLRLMREPVLAP